MMSTSDGRSDGYVGDFLKSCLLVVSVSVGLLVASLGTGLSVLAACRWLGVSESVAYVAGGAWGVVGLGLAIAAALLLRRDRGTRLDRVVARAAAEAREASRGVLDEEARRVLAEVELLASTPTGSREWPGISQAVAAWLREGGVGFTPIHRRVLEDWRSRVAESGGWGRLTHWGDAVGALLVASEASDAQGAQGAVAGSAEDTGARPSQDSVGASPVLASPTVGDHERLRQLVVAWREARCLSEPACGRADDQPHLPTCPVVVTEDALVDEVDSWREYPEQG